MFVRQLNARFASLFSGYREETHGRFTAETAARFIGDAKLVRCKDYVYKYDVENGGKISANVTTTPNWFFILTNAAVYFEGVTGANAPLVRLTFPDNVVNTPFSTNVQNDGVNSKLVFAYEGGGRYEEYKNLFYVMGDRVNVTVDIDAAAGVYSHGFVLLSGVELDIMGA